MSADRVLWFTSLFDELRSRNSRAHASLLAPSTHSLRNWLQRALAPAAGSTDGLQSTPVFEHKFGFRPATETMDDLVPALLTERLVRNMDQPPEIHCDQRFGRTWHPYTHQLAAWRALKSDDTSSVVVSAGTGAGKTECFLVPILDHLAQQVGTRSTELVGVQALFLYPLNALINSQRERLSAWTHGFGGVIRYCLYNGETEETVRAALQARSPEQVLSRQLLRDKPPPLLITNATMLEYMLVRPDDQPILTKSRGMLKYVVIDEAHTYVGSMAAELALLLRRVMNAFDVDPADVRFIATSATLGSPDRIEQVRRFLADVAGQEACRVEVITDEREIPEIPSPPLAGDVPDLDDLVAATDAERFDAVCTHRAPRLVREWLVARARTAQELQRQLTNEGISLSEHDLVRLLDCCKSARPADGEAFLPLRGHTFVRGLQGLWACCNPRCTGKHELLDDSWPFGAVYTTRRLRCAHEGCNGLVLELTLCQQCGTEGLLAAEVHDEGGTRLFPMAYDDLIRPPLETEDIETGDDEGGERGGDADDGIDIGSVRILSRIWGEQARSATFDPSITVDPGSGALEAPEPAPRFSLTSPGADGRLQCPRCGHNGHGDRLSMRSCRTGRTFVMGVSVPVLLEHMPEQPDAPLLPFGGRRTITFTDSRQGTARFAARSQGESERNYVRSFVYHQVMSEQAIDPAKVADCQSKIERFERIRQQMEAAGIDPSDIDSSLQDARRELAAAQSKQAVPLVNVANLLAGSASFRAMDQYWRDYLPFVDTGVEAPTLAKWMVLREFARRPSRRASLETLGLLAVRLPRVGDGRRPPELWRRWVTAVSGDVDQSWADLLKLLLDFFVRANSAVQLDARFFRWVGTNIRPKIVLPNQPPIQNRRISWPRFAERTRPRIGWLVVRALGLDGSDKQTLERVNDVLDAAWEHIKGAMRGTDGGYQLPMDSLLLEPVEDAWLCPLTRTMLDTTLLGHTPYQPPLDRTADTRCQPIRMPRVPHPFWLEGDAREWLDSDAEACTAREHGALSEFTERVLLFSQYYQVSEHSAQLQSSTLKRAERQFREGRLNLLSCSTTMEMGVDIGNLSGVAMNNAPPSPANFLQRVGRAGRRGESAAVSLTVCRHLPHDQAVFAEPDWPFRTPIHITPVKLDSARIVERHVRAAALTRFLQLQFSGQAIPRLTCQWFFVPEEGQTDSVCDRLVDWLRVANDPRIVRDLERLVRESGLHGTPGATLLAGAIPAFEDVAGRFCELRKAITDQMAGLDETDVARRALSRQLRRLDEEYLLGYLASEQVLPGYGFPTGVLPFLTTTAEELGAIKRADANAKTRRQQGQRETPQEREERIDARTRLTGYPSRNLAVALLEYAPGSKVVLDRRTYTSRGVTLNWHLPPDASKDSVPSVQALREAWRCLDCDSTGTEPFRAPSVCGSCGSTRMQRQRYLEPAGFSVDLRDPAEMDASPSEPVRVERPWISSGIGPLEQIGNPALVRFRHAPDGQVAYLSSGLHNHGYALCLRCGRAEPETEAPAGNAAGPLPSRMDGHRRLRGGGGQGSSASPCEGNENTWAIQRHLALGGSTRTDVLEIRLYDPTTTRLVEDRTLLTTTAVALRKVAAREIGVDERELGYQVTSRTESGARGLAILLYDTASGGAGFCADLAPLLPVLLACAVQACNCPRGCDQACHACLLSNDTQHDLQHIDRRTLVPADGSAPRILDQAFLDGLQLTTGQQAFGSDTTVQWGDVHSALVRHVRQTRGPKPLTVQLYVNGDSPSWDPVSWAGRRLVRNLKDLGDVRVRLVLPSTADGLEWQQRRQLASLAENEGVELAVGARVDSPMSVWAIVHDGSSATGFATDTEALPFSADWARRGDGTLFVIGPLDAVPAAGQPLDPNTLLAPPEPGVAVVDLRATRGPARDFGQRFWAHLDGACTGLLDGMRALGAANRIEVHDRYLASPLVVHALYAVIDGLKRLDVLGPTTHVGIYTQGSRNDRLPSRLRDDWADADHQKQVMEHLLRAVTPNAQIVLASGADRKRLQHHRALQLTWGDTEWELRLDAGFGYLEASGDDRFPFGRTIDQQVSKLLQADWELRTVRWEVPAYVLRG